MLRALGMWGLTEEGRFIRREGIAAVLLQTLYPDAQTQVTRDLRACAETVRKYADVFQSRHYSEPEIRRACAKSIKMMLETMLATRSTRGNVGE